ncbi:MAG: fatty acid desaturase [Proteobacteria bacterium]|nr:fatty acid desaturase [Pseudomonadota bacterium]
MDLATIAQASTWTSGLIDLPWWGYILTALGLTHITIAAVTIYLHRHSAHRALDLHPVVTHFFRFWLWLTTGMVTQQWTAIHRKHHARCETEEDPHSPQTLGLKKVFTEGAELYKKEAKNQETIDKFGHGTPDDWIERRLYKKHETIGIVTMLVIDLILFGAIGITIWAVQMIWIPLFAAGVINGVGHVLGYRNFNVNDASTNIIPWGILIGGEELHNNHHAYASSAKLSSRWYEFDIGWLYIRLMEIVGLATVKRMAAKVQLSDSPQSIDDKNLQAIITHRWDVLAQYSNSIKATCVAEIKHIAELHRFKRPDIGKWLSFDQKFLSPTDLERLKQFGEKSKTLRTIVKMRDELSELWIKSTASKEQLVERLEDWCKRAETSGITALKDFSYLLRRYA